MTTSEIQAEALREIKGCTTWLQGIGAVFGKPAADLQPGDVIVWNFGSTSTVAGIVRETASTITVEIAATDHHATSHRTFKKTRIVAILMNGKMYAARVTKEMVS